MPKWADFFPPRLTFLTQSDRVLWQDRFREMFIFPSVSVDPGRRRRRRQSTRQ